MTNMQAWAITYISGIKKGQVQPITAVSYREERGYHVFDTPDNGSVKIPISEATVKFVIGTAEKNPPRSING